MEKLLRCSDLGFDCEFEACEGTANEVINTAVDHARALHGLKDISGKDRMEAQAAIQDAFCVPKGGYNRYSPHRGKHSSPSG
jgi:predicted small metal-binding protein